MSKCTVIKSRAAMAVCFAILLIITGLSGCGGGSNKPSPVPLDPVPHVVAYATPSLVENGSASTATITWSSTDSTSCSSSPTGITGTSGVFTTPTLTATTSYNITCAGPTGTASSKATIAFAPSYIVTPITTAATCSAYPENATGTVYYFCDCQTGSHPSCIPGNDRNNDGLSPSTPKQTIDNAAFYMSTKLSPNDTVKLCRGGVFNATTSLFIGSNRCTGTCNDLRDYSPPFGGTAKPVINSPSGRSLFSFSGNGGVRILKLKLQGGNPAAYADANNGFFFFNGSHDVTMCGLDVNGFDEAVAHNGGNTTIPSNTNIILTGSNITNSRRMGYMGAGSNLEISYNHWDGNGGTNTRDHTIYLASSELTASNVSVMGNLIHGQYGPTCLGVVLTDHGKFDYLTVANNYIDIDASASTGYCYGMAFGSGGYKSQVFNRHTIISGNTIINGGNTAIYMATCPDCIIENNLIVSNVPLGGFAINTGAEPARPLYNDDVNERNLIRNNTIWYGPNATVGGTGIRVATEGSGHVVVNNTITYVSSSSGSSGGFKCFDYPLTLTSYLFIDNNNCFSNATQSSWVASYGNFTSWRTTAPAFDTASSELNPLFSNPGTNFTPVTGPTPSPLLNAGTTSHPSTSTYSGKDLTGRARPTSPIQPAIGAFEP